MKDCPAEGLPGNICNMNADRNYCYLRDYFLDHQDASKIKDKDDALQLNWRNMRDLRGTKGCPNIASIQSALITQRTTIEKRPR